MGVDEPSVILEASHPQIEKNMLHFFFNMGNLAKLKTNLQNPKRPWII